MTRFGTTGRIPPHRGVGRGGQASATLPTGYGPSQRRRMLTAVWRSSAVPATTRSGTTGKTLLHLEGGRDLRLSEPLIGYGPSRLFETPVVPWRPSERPAT